jgi:hypothetical protein
VRSRRPAAAAVGALLLAGLVLAVYLPVVSHDFVDYDDDMYVTGNALVQGGLSREGLRQVWGYVGDANWHPLTWLSHMLDVELFGTWAGGHHLTNLLLHLLNTLLAQRVLSALGASPLPALLGAALVGLHPLQVESVAWVAQRKNLLAGSFFWLGLLSHLGHAARPTPGRLWRTAAILALGLTAKPSLVAAPLLLLLLDWWPLGRAGRWALLEKVPLFLLAVLSSAATLVIQSAGGAVKGLASFPPGVRAANAAVSLVLYLRDVAAPAGLAVFYPHPGASLSPSLVLGAAALLAAVSGGAVLLRRRAPHLAVAWGWYLFFLGPVLGIVQVGLQGKADRYLYLPLGAVGLAAARSLSLADPRRRRSVLLAFCALLAAHGAMARRQVEHWRSTGTLLEHALAVTRDNFVAHANLGSWYARTGDVPRGLLHAHRSYLIRPDLPARHLSLAGALERYGYPAEAAAQYRLALGQNPAESAARRRLGLLLRRQGLLAEAVRELGAALRDDPGNALLATELAEAEAERGRRAVGAHPDGGRPR